MAKLKPASRPASRAVSPKTSPRVKVENVETKNEEEGQDDDMKAPERNNDDSFRTDPDMSQSFRKDSVTDLPDMSGVNNIESKMTEIMEDPEMENRITVKDGITNPEPSV